MTIDILVVFNMLLTGFDAPRLKRLYLGRKLKDHNLLQAITRVNRPYKDNKYGYLIDFADIKQNFKETNEAYLKELNRFNDESETGIENITDTLSQIIESPETLLNEIKEAKQVLFNYTVDNVEEFNTEISTIEDKKELLKLKNILISVKDCFNIVRSFGDDELKEKFKKLEIEKLPEMLSVVQKRINMINQKELFEDDEAIKQSINSAMSEIEFTFVKKGTEELKIVSGEEQIKTKWTEVINGFKDCIDPEDPEYITIREAFMLKFKEKGFIINSLEDFNERTKDLDEVIKKLEELKKKNNILLKKYKGDVKYTRVHKRIREENKRRENKKMEPIISFYDEEVVNALNKIKTSVDYQVYNRNDILKKDEYFDKIVMKQISDGLKELNFKNGRNDRVFIQTRISNEYLSQYRENYY